ncbi:dual specificity protein phosphatase 22-like [Styela clava]
MSTVVFFSVWGETRPIPKMGNGMNKVLPGLFIGNFSDSKDREQLQKNQITHILSIHDNAKPLLKDMKYLCIKVSDTPDQNLSQYFHKCIKFIHEARSRGGSVLVHCLAGVSRSVTVSVAYIATVTEHSWRTSLDAVRQSRTVANPNYGFQKQLQQFEERQLEKERKWIRQNAQVDPTDHQFIANLHREYMQSRAPVSSQERSVGGSSQSRPSGSYAAAAAPLNKQGDMYPYTRSDAAGSSDRNQNRDGVVFKNKF